MKGKKVKVYSVNADKLSNKLDSVQDIVQRRDLDFIMISEAGLGKKKSPVLKGYTSFRADHKHKNHGSIVYLKELYTPNPPCP